MSSLAPPNWRQTQGILRRGARSAQPAADTVTIGTLYYIIEDGLIEQSNGTIWEAYVGAGARSSTLVNYSYSVNNAFPPGTNQVRFNSGFPYGATTAIAFDNLTADGQDIRVGLLRVTPGSLIYVQDKNNNTQYVTFQTTTDAIDHTTWVEFPVVHVNHGSSIGGGQLVLVQSNGGPTYVPPLHAPTHETGGTDPITSIAGSIITSGTIPDARISSAIARTIVEQTTTSTGTQNNFDLNGRNTLLRCNNASLLTLTGFTVLGAAPVAGDTVRIVSINARVDFSHQTGSTAANQLFNFVTSGPTPLLLGSATYIYDDTTDRWRLIQHEQGQFITPTFAAGGFTANGTMTWTVASGNIITDAFRISGKQLTYLLETASATTIGGTPNTTLLRSLPYTTTKQSQQPCIISDPAVGVLGFGKMFVTAGGTAINIRAGAAAPTWGAGATAGCNGVINCEIT